ncbi:alpha-1,2-fucosyltransferase [Roseibium salinum]|uniref:Alpha-1,2-fucosyltransferase n=1 Tax=Roseibium salinum TaxID=1604349 RepID=A0ABT3R5Y4_9HYPH|nr:alpha-1,2-fucosyltransferase [Roseibium sp. DSM 29163]MCX2724546.1 alpha-1,2-fucosyltransferase [Roseibium sp. DSM 29163]
MIITHIIGGLGNQMFQYAVGRSLALASGQTLRLDLYSMEEYSTHAYCLDQLRISAEVASKRDIPTKRRKGGFFAKVQRVLRTSGNPVATVKEKGFAFDPSILSLRGSVYLFGYWQSEKYFSDIADAIRNDFALATPLTESREQILTSIRGSERAISVHVRRGDYLTNPTANAYHGICETDWYRTAMRKMEDRFGRVTFFLFSDDPKWARENIKSSSPIVFVEPRSDGKDAQDMHLMAACHSHIIANSTFSWWGAWLNPRKEKHVIAPMRWFKTDKHDTKDLIPLTWELL